MITIKLFYTHTQTIISDMVTYMNLLVLNDFKIHISEIRFPQFLGAAFVMHILPFPGLVDLTIHLEIFQENKSWVSKYIFIQSPVSCALFYLYQHDLLCTYISALQCFCTAQPTRLWYIYAAQLMLDQEMFHHVLS